MSWERQHLSVRTRGMLLAAVNARLGKANPGLQRIHFLVQRFLYSTAQAFLVLLRELSPICSLSNAGHSAQEDVQRVSLLP